VLGAQGLQPGPEVRERLLWGAELLQGPLQVRLQVRRALQGENPCPI